MLKINPVEMIRVVEGDVAVRILFADTFTAPVTCVLKAYLCVGAACVSR